MCEKCVTFNSFIHCDGSVLKILFTRFGPQLQKEEKRKYYLMFYVCVLAQVYMCVLCVSWRPQNSEKALVGELL